MRDVATNSTAWWSDERVILLADVPRLLPRNPNGRKIHVGSVYRWARAGLNGIKLRTFRLGGRFATTREELDRWALAVTVQGQPDRELMDEEGLRSRGLL